MAKFPVKRENKSCRRQWEHHGYTLMDCSMFIFSSPYQRVWRIYSRIAIRTVVTTRRRTLVTQNFFDDCLTPSSLGGKRRG